MIRAAIVVLALISISVSAYEHTAADQCDWSGRFVFFTVIQFLSLSLSFLLCFATFTSQCRNEPVVDEGTALAPARNKSLQNCNVDVSVFFLLCILYKRLSFNIYIIFCNLYNFVNIDLIIIY